MLRSIPLVTKGTTRSRKETVMFLGAFLLSVACHSLPVLGGPSPGVVSVNARVQADGKVCLIVHNGTTDKLRYDLRNNRGGQANLERHAFWGLWVGVNFLNVRAWVNDLFRYRMLPIRSPDPLPAGKTRSHLLRQDYRTLTPGRYRVCFRFRPGNHSPWQEQCSTPFRLPP